MTMMMMMIIIIIITITIMIGVCFAAVVDLNGRYFGGRVVKGNFYSLDKFHQFILSDLVEWSNDCLISLWWKRTVASVKADDVQRFPCRSSWLCWIYRISHAPRFLAECRNERQIQGSCGCLGLSCSVKLRVFFLFSFRSFFLNFLAFAVFLRTVIFFNISLISTLLPDCNLQPGPD